MRKEVKERTTKLTRSIIDYFFHNKIKVVEIAEHVAVSYRRQRVQNFSWQSQTGMIICNAESLHSTGWKLTENELLSNCQRRLEVAYCSAGNTKSGRRIKTYLEEGFQPWRAQLRSQLSACEICGHSGIKTSFSLNTFALPCQYHSANAS